MLVQFFDGPEDPGSDRWYVLARQIAERGHEVVVITSPVNYKAARTKDRLLCTERFKSGGSISVEYTYAFAGIRGSYARRYVFFLSFFLSAVPKALRFGRADVVYAVSPPLTIGLLGVLFSKFWGARLFLEVTDIWPDAAIEVGVLRSRILIGLARLLETLSYKSATKVVCLTEGISTKLKSKGVPNPKLIVVTNGVDFGMFRDRDFFVNARSRLRKTWGVTDKFVCMYIGAHGVYNALDTIKDAALELRDDESVEFVLVGEGDVKAGLVARSRESMLRNVRFLGLIPRSSTPELLSAADCFLLPILKGSFYDLNLPNKFFDYLGSGAPILVSGSCEAGRIVQAAGVGEVLEAEDGKALAAAILRLRTTPSHIRQVVGATARSIARDRYSREAVFRPLLGSMKL
jgi:glycosyltransferase involved in cell wall biosynthesis